MSDANGAERRTILVLGTNAGQADLIRHMKGRGWRVVGAAHVEGLPGEGLCDLFAKVDVRDVDAVCDLARREGADLVWSVSSDVAMTSAVAASERLGLPHFFGPEIVELFNRKHALRAWLDERGLSPVAYRRIARADEAEGWREFPAIVKPADAQGQRGMAIVEDAAALGPAVEEALRFSDTAILEQYLAGVEVSVNVLVADGRVVVDEVSERLVHAGALYGIPWGHLVPPHNVSQSEREAVRALVRDVVAGLGIARGCLYFQLKVTPEGPRIIEIAPRLDGCHMWRLIREARGIDVLARSVDVLLGEAVEIGETAREEPPHEGPLREEPLHGEPLHELIFQQAPPGTVFRAADLPAADAAYHEHRYRDGETVQPVNGQMEVVGYYVRRVPPGEQGRFDGDKASRPSAGGAVARAA